MSTRIERRFAELQAEGRAGLVVFVTAGDPDYATALDLVQALPGAGADVICLDNFFTGENLTRLRELALEEIRHLLDRRRQSEQPEGPQAGVGRVMVCLSSRSPNAMVLLRKGARLADRLHVPWYAVYIKTPSEDLSHVDAATQRQVADVLALAHQLGGVPMSYPHRRAPGAYLGDFLAPPDAPDFAVGKLE